jgi:hypothetical protein
MKAVIYGDFDYIPEGLIPEAQIELSITPIDLTTHWQRCGLISDMVAGYIAYAYPGGFLGPKSVIYSSISTIFQELIENAARYSRQRGGTITIRIKHYNRVVRIEVQNDTMPGVGQRLEEHLTTLFGAEDLDALHMQIMESQAEGGRQSGIGLLLLLKDYPVKLGVQLMRESADQETIIVRAHYHMEMSDYDMSDETDAEDAPPRSFT